MPGRTRGTSASEICALTTIVSSCASLMIDGTLNAALTVWPSSLSDRDDGAVDRRDDVRVAHVDAAPCSPRSAPATAGRRATRCRPASSRSVASAVSRSAREPASIATSARSRSAASRVCVSSATFDARCARTLSTPASARCEIVALVRRVDLGDRLALLHAIAERDVQLRDDAGRLRADADELRGLDRDRSRARRPRRRRLTTGAVVIDEVGVVLRPREDGDGRPDHDEHDDDHEPAATRRRHSSASSSFHAPPSARYNATRLVCSSSRSAISDCCAPNSDCSAVSTARYPLPP